MMSNAEALAHMKDLSVYFSDARAEGITAPMDMLLYAARRADAVLREMEEQKTERSRRALDHMAETAWRLTRTEAGLPC